MEFWNEVVIDRSFRVLQEIRKKFDFILIGGWAVYFLTGSLKSKDIDIIVDLEDLAKLRALLWIKKNDHLKRYETDVEGVSIDIYVPYYSKFVVPPEEILKNTIRVENFMVPRPEILLLLKQQAEIERSGSVKGQKDRVDIICLLNSGIIDWQYYIHLVRKFKAEGYWGRLKEIVRSASFEFEYLGIGNYREIRKIKERILEEMSKSNNC
ncbi:MAG: hypothetical protein QXQ64_07385 [Candidatus Bathyarchaeia archaeon]